MTKDDAATAERPSLPPSLERIVVRALSRPTTAGSRGNWSEAAKHRLYARMFPEQSTANMVTHVKPAA